MFSNNLTRRFFMPEDPNDGSGPITTATPIKFNTTVENNNISITNYSTVGVFVAVGSGTNTLANSLNATGWTGLGTTIFSTSGNTAVYGNSIWVAGGQGTNSMAYSNNGTTWVGLDTTIFGTSGNGIIWTGTKFIAVGDGLSNTISYSTNGLTWTGLGTSIFYSGNSITTNGNTIVSGGNVKTNKILYVSGQNPSGNNFLVLLIDSAYQDESNDILFVWFSF